MEVTGQSDAQAALPPGKVSPLPTEEDGWMGTRPRLQALENSKIPFPCQESNHHDSSEVQPIA